MVTGLFGCALYTVVVINLGKIFAVQILDFDLIFLLNIHGKQLWSCWDGQLSLPHFSWADSI